MNARAPGKGGRSFSIRRKEPPVPSPRRKALLLPGVCVAALGIALLVGPSAQADPGDPVIPSMQAVDDAQHRVVEAQASVDSIEAQLAAADDQLQALGVAADKASEAYDGAVYRWHQASR